MKGKRKGFVVKVGGVVFTCIEAKVLLSDAASSSGIFNHPRIWLAFRPGENYSEYNRVHVVLEFQRDSMERGDYGSRPEEDRAVVGRMDTAERWTVSYSGHVQMQDLERVRLGDGEVCLDNANRLRLKVSKLIGETGQEYNLYHVTLDECEMSALALEKLGAFVEWEYVQRGGSGVTLGEAHDKLRANEKHRRAGEKEKREEAVRVETVDLWTTAPESYDSGTTVTIDNGSMLNKMGKPWRKVRVRADEEEWHHGRYGSGLYEHQRNAPEPHQIQSSDIGSDGTTTTN